jgi:hypothetical protein
VGRYATRSFVFSFDNPVRVSARYLTLAEITPSADGGLTLTEEPCRFESGFSLITTAHLLEDFPAGVRASVPLSYDAEHFSSSLASVYVGYDPAPEECPPGQSQTVIEARPWLGNGACDCPTSSAPPTSARDYLVPRHREDDWLGVVRSSPSPSPSPILGRNPQLCWADTRE